MTKWRKENNPSESTSVAVSNLLTAMGVAVTQHTISRRVDAHYATPSLMTILHCLEEWGIQAIATRIAPHQLSTIATPALVHISDGEGSGAFAVLIKTGEQITYVDNSVGEVTITISEFERISTGVILSPKTSNNAGENQFQMKLMAQRAQSAARALRVSFLIVLPLLLLASAITQGAGVIVLFAILANSMGMVLCEVLIRIQNGQNTTLLNRMCGADSQKGCHSVLAQPIAKPFNLFSLSEIGLVYFLGCLLALGVSFFGSSHEITALTLLLIGALFVPAIGYLFFLQYSLGQWCRLCTLVHVLVCVEVLVGLIILLTTELTFPDWQKWIVTIGVLVVIFGVWLLASADRMESSTGEFELKFGKIVSNPDNFSLFLKPIDAAPQLEYKVMKSAPKAVAHIQVFSQVDCYYCKQVHMELEKYVHTFDGRVSVEIILLVSNDGYSNEIGKVVYGLAKHRSSDEAYAAYGDWIKRDHIDAEQYVTWKSQYGLLETEYATNKELEHIQLTIESAGVESTPVIAVNDQIVLLEGVSAVHATGRWLRKFLAAKI